MRTPSTRSVAVGCSVVLAACTSFVGHTEGSDDDARGGSAGSGDGGVSAGGGYLGASSSGAGGGQSSGSAPPQVDAAVDADAAPPYEPPIVYGDREWALWSMPNTAVGGSLPHPISYVVSDGVVTDGVTGLAWQAATPADTATFSQASAACEALALGGRSDWRLPTAIELFSILDVGRGEPSVDPSGFASIPLAAKSYYWTASVLPDGSSKRWAVLFRQTGGHSETFVDNTLVSYRCVASAEKVAAPSHYLMDLESLTDSYTGLTWQRSVASGNRTRLGAADYCAALELDGISTWRAPTFTELLTLVDRRRVEGPKLDVAAFADGLAVPHWSSSALAGYAGNSLFVDFATGSSGADQDSVLHPVRCVKE